MYTDTAIANDFDLNHQCEDIRYLCVTLEKGTTPSVDFLLDPATFTSCKVLDGCDGK